MFQQSSAKFICSDGTKIAYTTRTSGPPKPKLVLVHSLAMDGSFWDPVADLLALNHDVLTYDCRGHGSSDKPLGPYTIELFVADLSELLHHLQWPLVSVAGASMGRCSGGGVFKK